MTHKDEQERHAFSGSRYYDAGDARGSSSVPNKGKGIAGAMHKAFSTRQRDDDVKIISTRRATRTQPFGRVAPPVDPLAHRSKTTKQPKISNVLKGVLKGARNKLAKATAKWLILKSIPPTTINSPYFQTILDVATEARRDIQAPSLYDVGIKYLEEEYKDIRAWVEKFRPMWQHNGFIVMCDEWTSGTQTQ